MRAMLSLFATALVITTPATARGLQRTNEYSLRIYETGVWLGGR